MSKHIHLNSLISICLLLSHTAQGSPPAPAHSPEAHTDLICHTNRASECYPAIFQPTEHFQLIHDDQSIPPGLHVRLNLATGLKEARLNVPEPDDAPKADLVIIDNPPVPAIEEQAPLKAEMLAQEEAPSNPDQVDNFEGPIPHIPYDEADQFEYYRRNAAKLFHLTPSNSGDVLSAMTALTEFAHSQEWGLTISKDPTLVNIFVNFINPESASPIEVQSAAAQLLGTAIQNNPEALEEFIEQFRKPSIFQSSPMSILHTALKVSTEKDSTSENTILQKRLLFFLSQLCHDSTGKQVQSFVSRSGLSTLLAIFKTEHVSIDDAQDKVRAKIANFLADHILPVMANWEGGSLLKTTPPDVSILMTEKQSTWMNAMGEMKLWCPALQKAIKMYDTRAQTPTHESTKAYESIMEANEILDKVLSAHGCQGGCNCDSENLSAPFNNEEL